jgi:AmmeMemoRadiSam system protein B
MGELRGNGIREPSVAGTFYPAYPAALANAVGRFIREAQHSDRAPRAVIAPHAGYVYSGQVAGRAFAPLAGGRGRIRRAVVIGPSHAVERLALLNSGDTAGAKDGVVCYGAWALYAT